MAKRDVDRRVTQALRALTATKEDAVRDLAQAIDNIETLDTKIAELNTERAGLLDHAETRHAAARKVGWKTRELTEAGLTVPRPLDLPTLNTSDTNSRSTDAAEPGRQR